MITLLQIKEWLRIDHDEEDSLIRSLIDGSTAIIQSATGIKKEYIESTTDERLKNLYLMVQRILITDLYSERDTENKALISYYIQLEVAYKGVLNSETQQI